MRGSSPCGCDGGCGCGAPPRLAVASVRQMEVEGAAGVESEDGSADEEVQDEEALLSRASLAYEYEQF